MGGIGSGRIFEPLDPEWDYSAPLDQPQQIKRAILIERFSPAQRRSRFIHCLGYGYSITYASRYAGLETQQVYTWKKDYPEFATAWEDAIAHQGGDWWEDKLHEHAERPTPQAVTATIVGLKMRGRFTDSPQVQINMPVVRFVVGKGYATEAQIAPGQEQPLALPPGQSTEKGDPQ